jgi:hypothetical protein
MQFFLLDKYLEHTIGQSFEKNDKKAPNRKKI